ncbi:MAG: MBL fold metallo-hydrolase [Candidatus Brocadiaceae bacterium]|nr:MBL fold metallo-hydrolase [Candidatus Brocadiaceae bacterium]
MIFKQLNKTPCKTYLIGSETRKEVTLVDPVLQFINEYISLIESEGLKLTHIMETHTHADHISGAGALLDRTGAVYVMHQNSSVRCVSYRVADGFEFHPSGIHVKIICTPGHTNDSICLLLSGKILTGDTLFLDEGGAGRTDLPGGDPGKHWESLQKIMKLPEHLIVYPAHEYRGHKPSSLGEQKKVNPNLQSRSKEEYVKWLSGMELGAADWMIDVLKANTTCSQDPQAAWIPEGTPSCEVKGTISHETTGLNVSAISVAEMQQRFTGETHDKTLILDVREPEELKEELGVLDGAVNIPVGQIEQRLDELEKYKGKEIITICCRGGRGHVAASILLKNGFTKVYNLTGGMTAFRNAEKTR